MRIALALLVIAACKSKSSAPADKTGGALPVAGSGIVAEGSAVGSAPPAVPSAPVQEQRDVQTAQVIEQQAREPDDFQKANLADAGVDAKRAERDIDAEAKSLADRLTAEPDTVHSVEPNRRPGADLAQQIDSVRGKDVDVGTGSRGSRSDDHVPTALTPDAVLAKINSAYMPGLRRCYSQSLKRAPDTSGKITLALTVSAKGLTRAKVTAPDTTLVECVTNMANAWRFPTSTSDVAEAQDTTFTFHLTL